MKKSIAWVLGLLLAGMTVLPVWAEVPAEETAAGLSDAEVEELLKGEYTGDTILIQYDPSESVTTFAADDDQVQDVFDLGDSVIASAEVPEGMDVEEALRYYSTVPGVLTVCPDYKVELLDTSSEEAAALSINDSEAMYQSYLQQINAIEAWDYISGNIHKKVRVVVLDTGADVSQPDLKNVINKSLSKEVIQNSETKEYELKTLQGDDYVLGKAGSGEGHGTHVCGIIAGEANNNAGIAGTASAYDNSVVELVAVDIFSSSTTSLSYVVAGLDYARSIDAQVVNMSLGVKYDGISEKSQKLLGDACQRLFDQGTILVCAAGNYGYKNTGALQLVPADLSTTISVCWCDASGNRGKYGSSASNYGCLKDIVSPGSSILSTGKGNQYIYKTGSSMSAPMVTATVAMMLSVNPSLSFSRVKEILQETAEPCTDEDFEGLGILNTGDAVMNAGEEGFELPYEDVSEDDWYYEAVEKMYRYQIMVGLDEKTFGPYSQLARAQFAVMLYKLGDGEKPDIMADFPDVSAGSWYYDAVSWAAENNLMTGYANHYFGPADLVTRQQIVTILYRFSAYLGLDTGDRADLDGFKDQDKITAYAREAMSWAVANELIRGTSDGCLNPGNASSRAEAAVMLNNYLNWAAEQKKQAEMP